MDKKVIEALKKAFADNAGSNYLFVTEGKVSTTTPKADAQGKVAEYTKVGRHQMEALEKDLLSNQKAADETTK